MRNYVLALGVSVLLGGSTWAQMLLMEYSGTLSANSQLNGMNLGLHGHPLGTSFTIRSTFDSAADLSGTGGFGLFAAQSTIDLNSYGTYTISSPNHVFFQNIAGIIVRTGLASSGGVDHWDVNLSVSPSVLVPDAPTTGLFPTSGTNVVSPFLMTMASGDLLSVQSFVSSVGTVSVTSVPEPSSCMLIAAAAGAAKLSRRRQMSRQPTEPSSESLREATRVGADEATYADLPSRNL